MALPGEAWPFADPPDLGVFVTRHVHDGGRVRIVDHDHEGDWGFLTGDDARDDEGQLFDDDILLVCLEHVVAAQPELVQLADLPIGYYAQRQDDGTWRRDELIPEGE